MRILKNRILKSFRGKGSKGDAEVNYSLLNQPDGNFLQSNDFVKSLDLLCEGEIEGFVNGVEASTIYKVRFWMRYSGTSDLSNGPATYMIIIQDGDWLDYLYEGFHETNENKVFSKDWKLYSFQIATISNSPLEVIFGTNLDDVCIDDLHVVKKN